MIQILQSRILIVIGTMIVLASMVAPVLADCTTTHNGSGLDYVCTNITTVVDGTSGSDNIINHGTVLTYLWGGSFTVNPSQQDILTNNGIIGRGELDDGLWGSAGNDTIINNGVVNGGPWASWNGVNGAVFGGDSGGVRDHDTIIINNTVNGNVHGDFAEGGGDIITINGRVNGGVYGEGPESGTFGRFGNDTVILTNNAVITTIIDGMGGNSDRLRFDFSVHGEDTYIALSNQISSANPASGSLMYNGKTFTWVNFEILENSIEWTATPNQAPTAAIAAPTEGQVFTADGTGTASVALDGTGSSDSDGTIASYEWTWTGTSSGSANGSPINQTFGVGSYSLTLTVTDDDGATDTETRSFSVQAAPNQAPTAVIAAPIEGEVFTADGTGTALVALDGTGSSDSDGTVASYDWTWTGTSGGSATGGPINQTFGVGSYSLTLTVTDDDGAIDSETRSFTVQAAPNQAPTAVIAAPTEGQVFTADGTGTASVALDGTGSSDSDGTIASYDWTWTGTSGGSANGSPINQTFGVGSYSLTLTVTDDDGAIDSETRSFTVQAAPNQAPTAVIAAPIEGEVFTADGTGTASVALDGTGSSDSDGTIASYDWTWTGTNSGSASGSPINQTFGVGSYSLTLTVTDDDGATDIETRTFSVQAESPADAVPQLNYSAGDHVTLTWGGITWATGYQVQISASSSFETLACGGTIPLGASELSVTTCSLTPQKTYYWRVRATSPRGTGAWSMLVSFVIAAP